MAHSRLGDIAQLVERCVRNAEVRGSSPLISTTASEQGSLCSDVFLLLAAASAAKNRRHIAPLLLPFCAKGSVCCGFLFYDETGARSRRRISFSAPQSAAGAESAARRGGRAAANRAMRAARQKWGAARQKCGGRGAGWRGGRGRQIEPCVQRVKSGAQRVKNETGNAGAADARVFSCFAVYWNQPASQIAPIAVTNGR